MEKSMNVEIIDFQETPIAYLTHKGSHELLNVTISKFIDWRKDSGQSPIDQCKTLASFMQILLPLLQKILNLMFAPNSQERYQIITLG